MASWFVLVSKTPPRRLQDALKSLQDAPKSLQDAPRCLQDTPVGGQKTLIFLVFFKVFDVQGLPGAILARHGLQDDFKSPWNVFHGFQEAFKNLSDGSKGLQDTPKSLQDAPKTRPEKSKNRKFHHVVQFARFPKPSWGIFAQHGRQNASKMPPRASNVCLRPPRPLPKSASKSLLLRPRPFTKGGLAVVRPRRASSIKMFFFSFGA